MHSGFVNEARYVTTKLAAESKKYADAKSRIDGSLQEGGLGEGTVVFGGGDGPVGVGPQDGVEALVGGEAWREEHAKHMDPG